MNPNRYDATFEDYLSNIVLTKTQSDNILSTLETISVLFSIAYDDVEIYTQGSYATNTTVKPLTNKQPNGPGEYDVDIVLERPSWGGALDALQDIERVILEDDTLAQKLSATVKQSCVRVEYAPDAGTGVVMHIDIVPILNKNKELFVALRKKNEWKHSNPKELSQWTRNYLSANKYAAPQILTLKRMRDLADLTNALPSIVILTLVSNYYKSTGAYASDLVELMGEISKLVKQPLPIIVINNPAESGMGEDLISLWRNDAPLFQKVRDFFVNTHNLLIHAFSTEDTGLLQKLLSDDFPSNLHTPNVQALRSRGITLSTAGDLVRTSLEPSSSNGKRIRNNLWRFFEIHKAISFTITLKDPSNDVLWQVNNASGSEQLRGNFIESPSNGSIRRTRGETELYQGKHWMRCFAVNETNEVVQIGLPSYVDVWSNREATYRPTRH